jgi:hypothetical protein
LQGGRKKKRFEARWLQEDTVEEMIKTAWARAKACGQGPSFAEKVRDVHEDLHKWDKDVLKKPEKRIADLKRELERLRRGPTSTANYESQKEIMIWLELMLEQEEIYWLQRARANWLKKEIETLVSFVIMLQKGGKRIPLRGW